MNISDQKLNEILAGIINNYGKKGSITTNQLCDIMEKYDTNPTQMDHVYKSLAEAGIQIVDEDQRDRELFEQALSDIGLDDPVKMYLKDIGRVPLLSAEEEVELAKRMQEDDAAAKKRAALCRYLDLPDNMSANALLAAINLLGERTRFEKFLGEYAE